MGYQLIETIEVGAGGAASIEFTGIPQDGVDLVLVTSLRTTSTSNPIVGIGINGGYSVTSRTLDGNGSSVSSTITDPKLYANQNNHTANTFSSSTMYVSNYTSTAQKTMSIDSVYENNATTAGQSIIAGRHYTTGAGITAIELYPFSSTIMQYSTASLYMITAD